MVRILHLIATKLFRMVRICIRMVRICIRLLRISFEYPFEWLAHPCRLVRICIRLLRISFKWFEFAFEWLESLSNLSNFHFDCFESRSNVSNLHSIGKNPFRMVRICIDNTVRTYYLWNLHSITSNFVRMVRIPSEWFEFAFYCFESRSNGSNLRSNGLEQPCLLVQICIRFL